MILPVHPRPQAATPVSQPGFVAHLFDRGPVLRTCNRVMAHRSKRHERELNFFISGAIL